MPNSWLRKYELSRQTKTVLESGYTHRPSTVDEVKRSNHSMELMKIWPEMTEDQKWNQAHRMAFEDYRIDNPQRGSWEEFQENVKG